MIVLRAALSAALSSAALALALPVVASGQAASTAAQSSPAAPPSSTETAPVVVPVHHEPHHRQVFQYGPMRILDLQIPPNDISLFHSHEWPVLYVTLGSSATRTQNLGQDWSGRGAGAGAAGRAGGGAPAAGSAAPPAAGGAAAPAAGSAAAAGGRTGGARGGGPGGSTPPRATSTTSYIEQPITHRLENIGTGLFRAMVVVNETHGDDTTTEQAAGFDAKPELTNKFFRAYRIVLNPGEKTTAHKHAVPVAIFQATAGKALGVGAMKWEFNEPGQWAYFDTGDTHEVQNTGAGRLELIEVEVRRK